MTAVKDWLLTSGEPWPRYRTMTDLLSIPESDSNVVKSHLEKLAYLQVKALVASTAERGYAPNTRYNNAGHAIYQRGVLTDFGLQLGDPSIKPIVQSVLAHRSLKGAFLSLVKIPPAFIGSGPTDWLWMAYDAPLILLFLLALGLGRDESVKDVIAHLLGQAAENGWRCESCPQAGNFVVPAARTIPAPLPTCTHSTPCHTRRIPGNILPAERRVNAA